MTIKNKKNKTVKSLVTLILVFILNLLFIYFIKYRNQSLSLSEFNLLNFGNVLNLLVILVLITGLIFQHFSKTSKFEKNHLLLLVITNQFVLILAFASTLVNLPFFNYYYFGQNGNKLFSGMLFILYLLTLFSIIFLVWFDILQVKSLIILRSLINSLLLIVLILIFAFIYILGKESSIESFKYEGSVKDIAVVLGAAVWSKNQPSPSLASRVDAALDLFSQKKIGAIYLTGSNAPGELPEAEVAMNYIKKKKYNTSNIFKETNTTSTSEQIRFINKELISEANGSKIVVVSDSYHLVRVLEISKFHNIKINVVSSKLNFSFEKAIYYKVREALALTIFWFFAY